MGAREADRMIAGFIIGTYGCRALGFLGAVSNDVRAPPSRMVTVALRNTARPARSSRGAGAAKKGRLET